MFQRGFREVLEILQGFGNGLIGILCVGWFPEIFQRVFGELKEIDSKQTWVGGSVGAKPTFKGKLGEGVVDAMRRLKGQLV